MTDRREKKIVIAVALVLAMFAMQGCQMLPELLNEDIFMSAVGITDGSQSQARPETGDLVLIKFTNRSGNPAVINVRVHRPSGIDRIRWTLRGGIGGSVGQILTDCQDDPPSLVRLKFLGEDDIAGAEVPEGLGFADAFVFVNGVATIISRVSPPLELGVDFVCGDTIEYVIRATPEDGKKFEILAVIFREPGATVITGE